MARIIFTRIINFGADTRVQSIQIGVIILLSFAVVAFSLYQATVIPDQNAEVEFNHDRSVADDMIDLRNAVVDATGAEASRSAGVQLGTTYPARIFAVNPPAPTGRLQTRAGNVRLVGEDLDGICRISSGDSAVVESKTLQYTVDYNALQTQPDIRYEHSVTYRLEEGNSAVRTDQRLLDEGADRIMLRPLLGTYERGGAPTASVDFTAGETGVGTVQDPTLELTTPLDAETWVDILSDEGVGSSDLTDTSDGVEISLSGEYEVSCTPVSVDGAPGNSPDQPLGGGSSEGE